MSNAPSNHDHDTPPSDSRVEASSGSGTEDLVQSVLADARELLETFGNKGMQAEGDSTDSPASSDADSFDPGAVEAVLDRVGHLVDDLDHIEDAVDEAPRSEPFDLTAVAPPAPVSPDERIPDHGPSGPAVDLFATEPAPKPAEQPVAANPSLDFQVDDPVTESSSAPSSATDASVSEADGTSKAEPKDEAAMRLEQLLANRLAEEYESVEDLKHEKPEVLESNPVAEATPASITLDDSDSADDAGGMSDLTSIKTDDNEVGISSTRVIAADDPEPVDMTSLPEEAETTESVPMETVEGDLEETPAAEMVRIEEGAEATTAAEMVRVEDPVEESTEEATADPSEAESSAKAEPVKDASSEIKTSEFATSAESEVEPSEAVSATETTADHEHLVVSEVEVEDELVSSTDRTSTLVAIGALPYRFMPKSMHPLMTPLALSLALWVPVAWAFAFLGPTPVPGDAGVLQPGFQEKLSEKDGTPRSPEEPAVAPVDAH